MRSRKKCNIALSNSEAEVVCQTVFLILMVLMCVFGWKPYMRFFWVVTFIVEGKKCVKISWFVQWLCVKGVESMGKMIWVKSDTTLFGFCPSVCLSVFFVCLSLLYWNGGRNSLSVQVLSLFVSFVYKCNVLLIFIFCPSVCLSVFILIWFCAWF